MQPILAAVFARAQQSGEVQAIPHTDGWTVIRSAWVPGAEKPPQLPDIEYPLLQRGSAAESEAKSLSHGVKLIAEFAAKAAKAFQLEKDESNEHTGDADEILAELLDESIGEVQECDTEDSARRFWVGSGLPNVSWMTTREGPHVLLIDFDIHCVLVVHKSLCVLRNTPDVWSDHAKFDVVVQSPFEGWPDVWKRDEEGGFMLFWHDYIYMVGIAIERGTFKSPRQNTQTLAEAVVHAGKFGAARLIHKAEKWPLVIWDQGTEKIGGDSPWQVHNGLPSLLDHFRKAVIRAEKMETDFGPDGMDMHGYARAGDMVPGMMLRWYPQVLTAHLPGFYYDEKSDASRLGWFANREEPYFVVIDFRSQCVVMAHKSRAVLSTNERGNFDILIKSPFEGYADILERNQSTLLAPWWREYIGTGGGVLRAL